MNLAVVRALWIAGISYPLNLLWEYLHYPLYTCAWERWSCALVSALGDTLIILGIYALGAAIFKGWGWADSWSASKVAFVLASGLIVALAIEVKALLLGQWGYSSMPLVFGLGLSPLVQMLTLPLLALASAGAIASGARARAARRSQRR